MLQREQTELLIKNTTKHLIFVEGNFDVTTQEIAKKAGITRTLINYYFRSRNNLVEIIFDEVHNSEKQRSAILADQKLSFFEKIKTFIECSLYMSAAYPYLDAFIFSQNNIEKNVSDQYVKQNLKILLNDIRKEIAAGNLNETNPNHFILDIFSLAVFPNATKVLIPKNVTADAADFDDVIKDRRDRILDILFSKKQRNN